MASAVDKDISKTELQPLAYQLIFKVDFYRPALFVLTYVPIF